MYVIQRNDGAFYWKHQSISSFNGFETDFGKAALYKSEKQARILNAGFKSFALYGYKNASTDEIIKDADALQHSLRNPCEEYFFKKERTQQALKRLIHI